MDGPLLLRGDLASGLQMNAGRIKKPISGGLGIEINHDLVFFK
jgi:hypothetical protein